MQKAELVVTNVCPYCSTTSCVHFLSVDGSELHINCLECNTVYSAKVNRRSDGSSEVASRWREIGRFTRI